MGNKIAKNILNRTINVLSQPLEPGEITLPLTADEVKSDEIKNLAKNKYISLLEEN